LASQHVTPGEDGFCRKSYIEFKHKYAEEAVTERRKKSYILYRIQTQIYRGSSNREARRSRTSYIEFKHKFAEEAVTERRKESYILYRIQTQIHRGNSNREARRSRTSHIEFKHKYTEEAVTERLEGVVLHLEGLVGW
jgi:hypothetical protein